MNLVINGKSCTVADDDAMLIDVVRNGGLTGTKLVCGGGSPGRSWRGAPARSYSTTSRWSAVSCPPRPRATGK